MNTNCLTIIDNNHLTIAANLDQYNKTTDKHCSTTLDDQAVIKINNYDATNLTQHHDLHGMMLYYQMVNRINTSNTIELNQHNKINDKDYATTLNSETSIKNNFGAIYLIQHHDYDNMMLYYQMAIKLDIYNTINLKIKSQLQNKLIKLNLLYDKNFINDTKTYILIDINSPIELLKYYLYDIYIKFNIKYIAEYNTNFTLHINYNGAVQIYNVHSFVLTTEYFINLIDRSNDEHKIANINVNHQQTGADLIQFLYTGQINLNHENFNINRINSLFVLANDYKFESLLIFCNKLMDHDMCSPFNNNIINNISSSTSLLMTYLYKLYIQFNIYCYKGYVTDFRLYINYNNNIETYFIHSFVLSSEHYKFFNYDENKNKLINYDNYINYTQCINNTSNNKILEIKVNNNQTGSDFIQFLYLNKIDFDLNDLNRERIVSLLKLAKKLKIKSLIKFCINLISLI